MEIEIPLTTSQGIKVALSFEDCGSFHSFISVTIQSSDGFYVSVDEHGFIFSDDVSDASPLEFVSPERFSSMCSFLALSSALGFFDKSYALALALDSFVLP